MPMPLVILFPLLRAAHQTPFSNGHLVRYVNFIEYAQHKDEAKLFCDANLPHRFATKLSHQLLLDFDCKSSPSELFSTDCCGGRMAGVKMWPNIELV